MYFITCIDRADDTHRCFGYKETFDAAEFALNNNFCDMHETCYWYAVVEKLGPYIHPDVEEEYWFKYDKARDGFFRTEKPDWAAHTCNWGLG